MNSDDVERFSHLSVLSQPSSLELSEDELTEEIEKRTEEVRAECSESENGKSCVIFVKTCTTRFRKWTTNINALATNMG